VSNLRLEPVISCVCRMLFGGTGIEDVRSAFAQANIDHVIMGGSISCWPQAPLGPRSRGRLGKITMLLSQ
jgi:hypothetical protein